jgi:hypothetical protein
MADCSQP